MGGLPEGSWIRVMFNETNVVGLKARQPALFIDPGRQLFEEPTLFLHKHYVQSGARSSPETWEAAAYALQSWFDFLQATCKLSWRDANREKLIEYRDAYQIAISPKTGAPYASGTIGNRMLVVLAFYRHAAERGLYDGDLILAARDEVGKLLNITNDAMAHIKRGMQTIRSVSGIIPKRRISRLGVRPFSRLELQAFLNATGPRSTDRAAITAQRVRD